MTLSFNGKQRHHTNYRHILDETPAAQTYQKHKIQIVCFQVSTSLNKAIGPVRTPLFRSHFHGTEQIFVWFLSIAYLKSGSSFTLSTLLSYAVTSFIWVFSIDFNPLLFYFNLNVVASSLMNMFLWLEITLHTQRPDLCP